MDPDDLVFRRAVPADAPALAETTRLGFESYRAWLPRGWRPPPRGLEVRAIRERLGRPEAWCVLALDPGGEPAGHAAFVAARAALSSGPRIPGRAHLWMLFVRPPWWGTGLARRLHALALAEAAARGYATMQLVTPTGHARARAFYEREGWSAAPPPFAEPMLDLELIRYERALAPAAG